MSVWHMRRNSTWSRPLGAALAVSWSIHVTGHRIGLQDVVFYYNEGSSPEALQEAFPTLTLALIHKLIAFYLEHPVDVDAYISTCEREVERQRGVRRLGRMSPNGVADGRPSRRGAPNNAAPFCAE